MESIKTRRVGIGILVVIMLASTVPAGADVREWDGGGGGADTDWATPENWHEDGYSNSDNLTVLSGSPTSGVDVYADDGGTITLDGSDTVANFDSWQFYIGKTGGNNGLAVLNGASLTSAGSYLGHDSGASGMAAVSGDESTWTIFHGLCIGYDGAGELSITNGGEVSNWNCSLGLNNSGSSGKITVSGVGSTMTNIYWFYVGRYGTGVLNITDGGAVSNCTCGYEGCVGRHSGSSGTVTVSSAGTESTLTYAYDLYVGGSDSSSGGTGIVTVENGGRLDVAGTIKVWGTTDTAVNLTGGTLKAGTINHTAGGTFDFTGGTLAVGTFQGNLVNNGGTITPGSSPGLMTVTGDLTMNAGSIEMELGGKARGTEYDAIDVAGDLTLAGTLDVVLYGGFDPELDDTFDLLDWGTLSGTFGTVNLPGLSGGLTWDDSDLYNTGGITVVPEPATLSLLILGAVGLLLRRRKSRA